MKRSKGEEVYAQTFQFKSIVPVESHEELRDFFYKFAHNMQEAREYLQILKQVDEIKFDHKSELLMRIQAMALQAFPLAMRRMTDATGKRSLRGLINRIYRGEYKDSELQQIKKIHSHYKGYLNKSVTHQDVHSIRQALLAFPNTDAIEADLQYLDNFYYKLSNDLCRRYINISTPVYDYSGELNLLRKA